MGGSSTDSLRVALSRWVLPPLFLRGITFGDWLRLLRENGFRVDRRYCVRALTTTAVSVGNSAVGWWERRKYDSRLERVRVEAPVFILGHYRSGTTHCHNLLALDPRLSAPNLAQVLGPHTFLSTGALLGKVWGSLAPRTRSLDNVRLNASVPLEDEIALVPLTLRSPYLAMSFPGNGERYAAYATLRGMPADQLDQWKRAFVHFAKKLTLKYENRLVLKSPPHTGRIRLLLEMFPDARFVHIHRNPYAVFQSSCRSMGVFHSAVALQRWDLRGLDEHVLNRYRELYDAFYEQRGLIPEGRLHEVAFEDLEEQPLEELRKLYEALELPAFSEVEPRMRAYLEGLTGYRKNRFPELSESQRAAVAREWKRSFEEWGYPV